MTTTEEAERLRAIIRDLHSVDAVFVRSEPVREAFEGEPVWDGTVQVFEVKDHPSVKHAYAWSYETDEGGRGYVAVLGAGPIKSALDAVRAFVVADLKRRKEDSSK